MPSKDFLTMEGVTTTRTLENTGEILSDGQVIELKGENGLTKWFGRYFHKDICTTGVCRMVRLWIFWDNTGNYLGMQFNENEPLTKSDHTPFEIKDYVRLDEIMADTASILRDLLYEDLTVETTVNKLDTTGIPSMTGTGIFEVDGYSSATTPALKEYVVDDAVFTCYTLWHTVYGETKMYIDSLLKERITPAYMTRLLEGDSKQQLFALGNIPPEDTLSREFEARVLQLIASPDMDVAKKALSLITPGYLADENKQLTLVEFIKHAKPEIKYAILYKLQVVNPISPEAILLLLEQFESGNISQGALNHIFKIIEKQAANSKSIKEEEIQRRLKQLTENSDPYTAILTKKFMEEMKW
jgi:hypothetical protein